MRADVLVPIAWVGALHLAAWAIGQPLHNRLLRDAPHAEGGRFGATLSIAIGFAVLANGALVLAAAHALYAPALIAAVVALALVGALRLAQSLRAAQARGAAPAPLFTLSPADAPLAIAVLFVASTLPKAIHPFLMHDDNVYHLRLPREYLTHHGLVSHPMSLFANMPHMIEVLYTLPMSIGDYTAAKVLACSLTFWTLAGLVAFARPRLGRALAGVVALVYVSGKNVQWHLGLAYVEPVIGFFLLAAVLALVAWRETGNRGYLRVVAIACGVALASKYSAWPYAAVILAVTAAAIARAPAATGASSSSLSGRPAREIALLAGIAAALVAPWLIKNALVTGNPIYPNLFGLFDGRFWSDVQEAQFLRSQTAAGGIDRTLFSYIAIPIDLALRETRFFSATFSITLMALFLASLARPAAYRVPIAPITAIAGLGFLAWVLTIEQGRFLVAWVPVMTLAAATALAPLRDRPRATLAAAALVLAIAAVQMPSERYPYTPRTEALTRPRAALETQNGNHALCAFLNKTVPASGKVLAFWDNRFFFLERDYYADSAYEAPSAIAWLRSFDDPEAFARELVRLGFTHVVVNAVIAADYMNDRMGVSMVHEEIYPQARLDRDRELFDRFTRECLEKVHEEGRHVVFRVRAEALARDDGARYMPRGWPATAVRAAASPSG